MKNVIDNLPLIVILGETASGKSTLALELAQVIGGEIICADSWTVRKELNIGSAKPSMQDQLKIPHHLIDIVNPDQDFTAAVFKELATEKINEITLRGKIPLLVGGSGLYIDGVIYDYGFLPEGDRSTRTILNNLSNQELLNKLQELKINLDNIDIHNKRRLIRLLETNGQRPIKSELRKNTIILGIKTDPLILRQRISDRVNKMIEAGLEQEVQQLSIKYGWQAEGLKGIGYREWQDYFKQQQTLDQTKIKIINSTLNLAKKQRTWFKRNKSIHWLSAPVNINDVVEIVTTILNK